MTTLYPSGLDSYTDKTDLVDTVDAEHVNDLQDAVVAIETELGTNPSGIESTVRELFVNQTLASGTRNLGMSGDVTFLNTDPIMTRLLPDADRTVTLPTGDSKNHPYFIWNDHASFVITIRTGETILTLNGGEWGLIMPFGGTLWAGIRLSPRLGEITLADGGTINWDVSTGGSAKVTLGGDRTMAAPTNLQAGQTYILRVIQDGTPPRLITWNSIFKWPGGIAPTLSVGSADIDVISFGCDGTNLYGSALINMS